MDTTRTRMGAASSPDRRPDRATIDARVRALTVAAALAGAAGVTGFGALAAQGSGPGTATVAATTSTVATGGAAAAGSTTTDAAATDPAAATAAPTLQAAAGQVTTGAAAGQVTTGGSTR